ncbi:MAG TPA: GLPGLI family protein [Saprospiraceae bacterium]|nr:GLPGLI family protein [Saprospiraceae bacterium]
MKNIIFIILSIWVASATGQDTQGQITYERKVFWANIYAKLPFLSQEEKEKELAIWGKEQGKYADKYTLDFNPSQTLYQQIKNEDIGGWSWKGDGVLFYRDLENKTMIDKTALADKDFIIKGDTPRIKWKIQNEIRDIQGYLCMKAVAIHPIHNTPITAWYSDKIPVSSGPEGIGGLPGMILMLIYNEDDVSIEATSITISENNKDIALPKKMKGKETTHEKYKEDFNKYVKQSIEGKRNPYWAVRL